VDIDAQAHAVMLHPSRPGAASVYPRHSDALILVSKTTQGHNGTMAQSYHHHTAAMTSTEPPSLPCLGSIHRAVNRTWPHQRIYAPVSHQHTKALPNSSFSSILTLSMLRSALVPPLHIPVGRLQPRSVPVHKPYIVANLVDHHV
jgi:hypothetical protein